VSLSRRGPVSVLPARGQREPACGRVRVLVRPVSASAVSRASVQRAPEPVLVQESVPPARAQARPVERPVAVVALVPAAAGVVEFLRGLDNPFVNLRPG